MYTDRVREINQKNINEHGKYVLYWMQQSQRVDYNHALSYAIDKANNLNLPLVVCFGLTSYPEANERHYYFMLEGLKEVAAKLEQMQIKFVVQNRVPNEFALELSKESSLTIVDKAYLKVQKLWRRNLADKIDVAFIEIESDLIVPVEVASQKEEYAAYTIRKKINRQLDNYLFAWNMPTLKTPSLHLKLESLDINKIDKIIDMLNIAGEVKKVAQLKGGYSEAKNLLEKFIEEKFDKYAELRNDPTLDYSSHLSSYLHFGQISALEIALEVRKNRENRESLESFLDELIIRRELAFNFCYYNADYDNIKGLKANWIYETLEAHEMDSRDYIYTESRWEKAETHDDIWNACQFELMLTGEMHGYMRMYWGKKILEWSESYEEAYRIAIYLNNKYAIDGRDANSFAGIAWCFGKHDRPWFERAVFGKIRYMNANGVRRKFKVDKYIKRINSLKKI